MESNCSLYTIGVWKMLWKQIVFLKSWGKSLFPIKQNRDSKKKETDKLNTEKKRNREANAVKIILVSGQKVQIGIWNWNESL